VIPPEITDEEIADELFKAKDLIELRYNRRMRQLYMTQQAEDNYQKQRRK
jgi:hypothetical protein